MRFAPRTIYAQLVLLLALLLIATATLTHVALRYSAAQRSSVESLSQQVVAAVRAIESGNDSRKNLPPGIRFAAMPRMGASMDGPDGDAPPDDAQRGSRFPFLAELRDQISTQLDGREVQIDLAHRGVAWIRMSGEDPRWIGVALTQFHHRAVLEFSALVLAIGGVLVLLAAGYYARRLGRLLGELAAQAPALARGELLAPIESGPIEVRALGRALADSSRQVAAVARERSVLLAGISHDLRTPLARLQLALELLPDTDPALSAGMQTDIVEIEAIISQFIAYARDERDEPEQAINLVALAELLLHTPGRIAADWNVIAPTRMNVRGRPLALKRAWSNLLQNAERYGTAPYEILLHEVAGHAEVVVSDRGVGLPPEQLQRVLEPFQRGRASQDHPGAGLGLAIAARVASMHGGALVLSNRDGGGIRAELRLGAVS
jgi:two-component system osmolarity sensor histidine kinase EnvZ